MSLFIFIKMSEETNITTPLSSQTLTSSEEEIIEPKTHNEESDTDSDELNYDVAHDNWNYLSEKGLTQQQQMLNSVFNKQQEIATNLNKVRENALKNLKQNENKQEFEDDAEEYVKSIGMKVLRETNPDFADIVDEAKAIDKNFNPNRVYELEQAKDKIIKKMREYEAKPDHRGWDNMVFKIADDLKKFGYIYNPTDLEGLTKDEIDKLTQHPFPYSFNSFKDLDKIDVDELEKYLSYRVSEAKKLSDKVKAHRTDLQQQMNEYKDNTSFTTNQKVAIDNRDEFYATAKPTLEAYKDLITKYSDYLNPQVMTELEEKVKQINDYISDARLKGVSAGQMAEYTRLVNQVRKNVRDNYQNILTKMQAYSNSVGAEDAILNEIKSLAAYEQYSQLPPAIFEKLPDEIKNKVMRLMELKAKLQKQQGKTKTISNKYKLNADNHPLSSDSKPKLFNPMLNKGYSIHNKIAQHSLYNASFQ